MINHVNYHLKYYFQYMLCQLHLSDANETGSAGFLKCHLSDIRHSKTCYFSKSDISVSFTKGLAVTKHELWTLTSSCLEHFRTLI